MDNGLHDTGLPDRALHDDALATAPLVQIEKVSKRFGRKAVLKRVELQIAAGEVVALLGDNGAGKSTLMRMVAGLSRPDRGAVLLGGAAFAQAGHELRRYIGYVGHAPLLYEDLTATENLHFFAALYDLAAPDARIEALLNAVNLWTRRRDRVRTYSRGMKQRLAIARALLPDPPVLLLDEPDTGLDQASIATLHRLFGALGAADRAILLSTHNFDLALAWADTVAVLRGGSIVAKQTAKTLDGATLRQLYAGAA